MLSFLIGCIGASVVGATIFGVVSATRKQRKLMTDFERMVEWAGEEPN